MDKKALRLKMAKLLLRFGMVETTEGALHYEGELAVGTEVFTEDAEGNMIPAADGEYTTDTQVIVVADGKISEIKDKENAEEEPTPAEEPVEEPMAEEEPTEEPVNETPNYDEAINTLLAAVEELAAQVEALTADVEEIKKEMTPNIEDEFSKDKHDKTPVWDRFSRTYKK